jgi:hypothetical protein
MNPSEIIANHARKEGDDPLKIMNLLHIAVSTKSATLLRQGDTIFLITNLGNHAVDVLMFTADGAMNLPSVVTAAIAKLKKAGAQMIYGDLRDEMFVDALRQLNAPIEDVSDKEHTWSLRI